MCLDQYQLLHYGGAHTGAWTAGDLQRGTVLQVTPAGNIPGSCAAGCKGADPHQQKVGCAYPGVSVSILPSPSSHRAHSVLSFHRVFLLILLPLKHFWFPGLPERTELVNESSCEPVKSQEGSWFGMGCKSIVWDSRPNLWPSPGTCGSLHVLFSNATLVLLSIKEELPLF